MLHKEKMTRKEIDEYIEWAIDSFRYFRNLVPHKFLPELAKEVTEAYERTLGPEDEFTKVYRDLHTL